MDLLTFFIGLVLGLLVGFVIAWFWANSIAKTKKSAKQDDETELKAIMAHQAESHLQTSKETIQSIEFDLTTLRDSIAEYEKTLSAGSEDYSQTTFFGEHASMFLRNADSKSDHPKVAENPDNQPRDFANSGSGVFVGSPKVKIKEKSNN